MSTDNATPKAKRSPYFVVTSSGDVYRAASKKAALHAADICGGYEVTEQEIGELPMGALVAMYNRARPEKTITKFRDRETAVRALNGALDFLGKPMPSHMLLTEKHSASTEAAKPKARTRATTTQAKEQDQMTDAPAAKKRGPKKRDIPQEIIDKVVALRSNNATWSDILKDLGLPISFVHRVRAELKKINPSMVKPLGPGSPNYGTGETKRAQAKAVRTSDIPQESF